MSLEFGKVRKDKILVDVSEFKIFFAVGQKAWNFVNNDQYRVRNTSNRQVLEYVFQVFFIEVRQVVILNVTKIFNCLLIVILFGLKKEKNISRVAYRVSNALEDLFHHQRLFSDVIVLIFSDAYVLYDPRQLTCNLKFLRSLCSRPQDPLNDRVKFEVCKRDSIIVQKLLKVFTDHLECALDDVVDFCIILRIESPWVENYKFVLVHTKLLVQNCPWRSLDVNVDSAFELKIVQEHHCCKWFDISIILNHRLLNNVFERWILTLFNENFNNLIEVNPGLEMRRKDQLIDDLFSLGWPRLYFIYVLLAFCENFTEHFSGFWISL